MLLIKIYYSFRYVYFNINCSLAKRFIICLIIYSIIVKRVAQEYGRNMAKYLGFKGIHSNNENPRYEMEISGQLESRANVEESGNVDTDDIVDAQLNEFDNTNSSINTSEENYKPPIKIDYWNITKIFICIVILMFFKYVDSKENRKIKERNSIYKEYQSPQFGEKYRKLMEEQKKLDEKLKIIFDYQKKSVGEYYQNSQKKPVFKFDYRNNNTANEEDKSKNNLKRYSLNNTINEDLLKNSSNEKNESKQSD